MRSGRGQPGREMGQSHLDGRVPRNSLWVKKVGEGEGGLGTLWEVEL